MPLLSGWSALQTLKESLPGVHSAHLEGVPVGARPWLLAALPARPMLVVTWNEEQARALVRALETLLPEGRRVELLPDSLSLLLDDEDSERDISRAGTRLAMLVRLAQGETFDVLVAVGEALVQPLPPPSVLKERRIAIGVGETLSLDALAVELTAFGYVREDLATRPGVFARRGDILDIFPAHAARPYRIDLFGDDVESIRPFDVESQRSEGSEGSVEIFPAHEVVYTRESTATSSAAVQKRLAEEVARREAAGEDAERIERLQDSVGADIARLSQGAYFSGIERYLPLLHPDAVSFIDYLPADTLLLFDEPSQVRSHAMRAREEVQRNLDSRAARGEIVPVGALPEGDAALERATQQRPSLLLSLREKGFSWLAPQLHLKTEGAPSEKFYGRPAPLAEALDTYVKNGARVAVISAQAPRVRGILAGYPQGIGASEVPIETLFKPGVAGRGVALVNGVLSAGFRLPDASLVVLTDAEVFGDARDAVRHKRLQKKEFQGGMRLTSLLDIKPGDYVVHLYHGIGIYQGLTRRTVPAGVGLPPVEREFLMVSYEGNDKLYVPVDQLDRIQKYIGSGEGAPGVHKLGSQEWLKATARAQRQVREMAGELIKLYAARQSLPGHAYATDSPWVREMEDAFPYVETPDQLKAIEDVKRDLAEPRPMDRLICGDVGFGKTEVAMRAAFQVASEGRQVAVLCPTTVLAAQHYHSFCDRLGAFPIRIDQLSRFRSPKQQAQTLLDLKVGGVDIVVGTHRILSKDVEFKDLGLVIVDEEQRFGVTHKERLKQLRQSVDVVTMTATPIPRTLHMSLSGIRDLSLINDPPEGRLPIKTFIKERDDLLIQEAILRELERGGQVYFVHNRVQGIEYVRNALERLVPTARFRVGHGQMDPDTLEEIMLDFYQKKFDVLVSTTIVESGLDIPNVNTIIVDNADTFGLGQLYQLRGRVGRSRAQGYAYLLYKRGKQLKTVAEQRLEALKEFSDLSSGYKIALRDLELRGAGNLLGAEQHGTVAAVGFDLYTQLLEQAIHEAKGEEPARELTPLPSVDLPVAATIPEKYVPGEAQRILMYKKLAAVRERADVARLQEEFEDRFGDPPPPVWNALALLRLRLTCQEIGIDSIQTEAGKATIAFKLGVELPRHAIRPLSAAHRSAGHVFESKRVVVRLPSATKILPTVEELVEVIKTAIQTPPPPRTTPGGASTRRVPGPREPGWR
jgi:transcription-repair coupling factor (superfamily II helicase)